MGARTLARWLLLVMTLGALAVAACTQQREIQPLPDDIQRSGDASAKPTLGPEIIVTRPVVTKGINPRIHVQTLPYATVTAEATWPNGEKPERLKTVANGKGVAQLWWTIRTNPGQGRVEVRILVEADGQRGSGLAYFEFRP